MLNRKMKDIFARNEEKRRNERKMAKLKKKEEKLKRRMDQMSESPIKRERLELMDDDSTVRYDFYKYVNFIIVVCVYIQFYKLLYMYISTMKDNRLQ